MLALSDGLRVAAARAAGRSSDALNNPHRTRQRAWVSMDADAHWRRREESRPVTPCDISSNTHAPTAGGGCIGHDAHDVLLRVNDWAAFEQKQRKSDSRIHR